VGRGAAVITRASDDDFLADLEALRPRLEGIARRWTRDWSRAEDLAQSAIVRAWFARSRFRPGSNLVAYARTIMQRLYFNEYKRIKRQRAQADSAEILKTLPEPPPVPRHRPEVLETLEDPVARAMLECPEHFLEPFLLSTVEELSHAEIAAHLGVPLGTVMSRVFRARHFIRARAEVLAR
jgi:RNA polymerase sigma-70 factor (ECF subfamily)